MTKKRKIILAVVGLIAVGATYLFVYEPSYAGDEQLPARPLVIAHRGFGNHAPDNSLIAAELALEADMDGIDVDGQLSLDSEFVIFHDLSVDRLTNGEGRVSSKTLAELRLLDLGPKFEEGYPPAFVATFEEFLRATRDRAILMVELKVPGARRTGLEDRAVEIVRTYDAFESVVFSSFNPLVLYRLKRLDERVRTALIFMDTNWNAELVAEIKPGDEVDLPWIVRQEWFRRGLRKVIRPDLLSVNHEVDPKTIDRLLAKGWPIFLWTLNDEEGLRWALDKKPYGVISDEPQLAKRLRNSALYSRP